MLKKIYDLAKEIEKKGFIVKITIYPRNWYKYNINIKSEDKIIDISEHFSHIENLLDFLNKILEDIKDFPDQKGKN